MLVRVSWFATGVVAGGWITVRALRRRKPTPMEWRDAAAATGADLLDFAARAIRPNRSR